MGIANYMGWSKKNSYREQRMTVEAGKRIKCILKSLSPFLVTLTNPSSFIEIAKDENTLTPDLHDIDLDLELGPLQRKQRRGLTFRLLDEHSDGELKQSIGNATDKVPDNIKRRLVIPENADAFQALYESYPDTETPDPFFPDILKRLRVQGPKIVQITSEQSNVSTIKVPKNAKLTILTTKATTIKLDDFQEKDIIANDYTTCNQYLKDLDLPNFTVIGTFLSHDCQCGVRKESYCYAFKNNKGTSTTT